MAASTRFASSRLFGLKSLSAVKLKPLAGQTYLRKCFAQLATQSNQDHIDNHDNLSNNPVLAHDDYFGVKNMVSLADLFKAKVHLAHFEGALHPKMEQYIYGTRLGQHVFDLDKSLEHMRVALNVLAHVAYKGGIILMISTHQRYERLIQETARDSGEYFSTGYWRRGSLTNAHKMIGKQVVLPDLILFPTMSDFNYDPSPLVEVSMCGIPSIGIVDSNSDPSHLTYRIPGNDDTPSSVKLYCRLFKETICKAKEKRKLDNKHNENKM